MDKKKILIADADEEYQLSLKQILEEAGYEILVASSIDQALKVFHTNKPNLCIMDIMLPEPVTGGLALLNLIKKIDATTTCFIFTTLADDGKEYIAKELGVDGYYLKPVAKDTVLYIVGSGLRLQDRKKRGKI